MTRKSKTTEEPRIGQKDLQDPDRVGAGRPVQPDEEGRSRPTDDAPGAK